MYKKILLVILGLGAGLVAGFLIIDSKPLIKAEQKIVSLTQRKQVIGFLPYWLISSANSDYSKYINSLSYFGLTIDTDGKILKFTNPGETEPGWLALDSGKLDPFFAKAKEKKTALSLVVFSGDQDSINSLMDNPVENAKNLVSDVAPLMRQYGFSDLNLDIEKADEASEAARVNFSKFAAELKSGLTREKLGTLTVDVSPTAFIKKYLVNPQEVAKIADYLVVMAYDFHFIGSLVTGPVAPINGVEKVAEFDTKTSIDEAVKTIPAQKLILGVPLYGYEWETIGDFPRAGVIPGSGLTASSSRVAELLDSCANCKVSRDNDAEESYIIYQDDQTGTYHQIFYPDAEAISSKVKFAKSNNLGGLALWALGYEDPTLLNPLLKY